MTIQQFIGIAFLLAGATLVWSGYRVARGSGPGMTRTFSTRMTQPFTWVVLVVGAGGIAALLMLVIPW